MIHEKKAFEPGTMHVLAHLKQFPRSTVEDVAHALNISKAQAKNAIQNLQKRSLAERKEGGKGMVGRYSATSVRLKKPKLTTPTNGPGYTPMKWAQGAISNTDAIKPPKEKPIRNGTTSGSWIAPKWELARPGAEDHKQHGSRRGDEVQEWCPPLSMCVGRGVERFMPDRLQR
jgi:hypothetical protein